MKTTSLHCYDHRKTLHVVVFLVAMLSIRTQSANAMAADLVPQDSRVSVAADNFKNAWQYAVAYQLRPPRRLRARHLELALSAIATTSRTHAFVWFGPVWQLPLARGNDRWHVQLGFSPTLLTGSTINDRHVGGNFHFTSSASLGAVLGDRRAVSIAHKASQKGIMKGIGHSNDHVQKERRSKASSQLSSSAAFVRKSSRQSSRRVLSCASGAGTVSASARMAGRLSPPRTCIW